MASRSGAVSGEGRVLRVAFNCAACHGPPEVAATSREVAKLACTTNCVAGLLSEQAVRTKASDGCAAIAISRQHRGAGRRSAAFGDGVACIA